MVDTSAWVEYLREAKNPWGDQVEELILANEAAWCDQVLLELIKGVTYAQREKIKRLERIIPSLEIDSAVWSLSRKLAWAARASGITTPVGDVLVAACARKNEVSILHKGDDHFKQLSTISIP
jgi:predicted nucleic acid-binding protein